MRRATILLSVLAVAVFPCVRLMSQVHASKTLDIYVIDVEGGNSTLIVSPSRESLLIDTGYEGAAATRDAGRIMEAIQDAGLQQIDHLITTHWHGDHFGGMVELAPNIPIREFIDHGPATIPPNASARAFLDETYPQLYAKAKHTVAKAGDRIPMPGLDVRVVASAGETIKTPLPGAGNPNPYCGQFKPADNGGEPITNAHSEDSQSVAVHITFGKFRTIHLGDLIKSKEFELVCPANLIGTVDVLLGLHHGVSSSNSEVFVYGLHLRVAIMNNGTAKGGEPEVMKVLHSSPGLEDLWQLHFSLLSGQEYTVPGMFIANVIDEPIVSMPVAPSPALPPRSSEIPIHSGKAYWIKVSARPNGSFTVTNQRNLFSKTYDAVPKSEKN